MVNVTRTGRVAVPQILAAGGPSKPLMSYRDVSESLRSYRDRVAGDLEQARQAAKEAATCADKVRILEKELAETDSLIAKMAGPRSLPLLENVAIAAPCSADWEQMVGDERVRFCRSCEKNVYNLSAMPRDEAEALLGARDGKMCVRLYKRADGTVLTSDCPVGVKRRRRRRALAGVLGGGLLAAGAAMAAATGGVTQGSAIPIPVPVTGETVATAMGSVVAPTLSVDPTQNVRPMMGAPAPIDPAQPAPRKGPKGTGPARPRAIMGDVR
jgi:hypothetical protein